MARAVFVALLAAVAFAGWSASAAADENPVPSLLSLSPGAAAVGGESFVLTVDGTGFVATSQVLWDGAPCPTNYVSSERLTAEIGAAALTRARTVPVRVSNPAPGGGVSAALDFVVAPPNPTPEVAGLSPSEVEAGSGAFGITVIGSGFVRGSTVLWNGEDRATGFISPTMLTATIRAADVALPGLAFVSVASPLPGGGLSAESLPCTLRAPVPALQTVAPVDAWAWGPGFTLTVTGSGFTPSSQVHWAGVERPTVFVSSESLEAAIDAADVKYQGPVSVRVYTPAPGGGLSSALFVNLVPDTAPPVTRALGLAGTWHRSDVVLRLSATDVGLGVAWTFYRVDGSGSFRSGTKVTVKAPASHANDGLHTVTFYSVDQALNWETRRHVRVGIDTRPPTTAVAAARVKQGSSLKARYRVADGLSSRARDAQLVIVDPAGKVRVRRDLGQPPTGSWRTAASFSVRLPRGAYTMKVLAHDLAGNAQATATRGALTVY